MTAEQAAELEAAKAAADEIEMLRAALISIIGVNDGERICPYSWGQEYYRRCFDIASEALQKT